MGATKITYQQVKDWGINWLPKAALVLDLVLVAIFYVLVIAHLPTQNGDNIEHIHSSFMVAIGQVPYRDFFQHHNPLLWYIFAPLAKILAYDTTIAEIVCLISFLVFLKSLVYVYRLAAEFLTDKFWALMATAMVMVPEYKLFAIDFRPDNYMIFCLMGGIYYLFSHLRDKKQWQLSVAFVWFFMSFLFAQKALFPLFCLGICVVYLLYKGEVAWRVFFKALIVPFLGGVGFGLYLYHYDMIELYYRSNYTFNLNLVDGFEMHRVAVFPKAILLWVCLGFAGAVAALFYRNIYWRVLSFLFVTEFIQRRFYFSPYVYYYWLLSYLAVLCGVSVLYLIDKKSKIVRFVLIGGLYYFFIKSVMFYMELNNRETAEKRIYLPDYITRHITPCDYVFNGDGYMYNLFAKDPSYYWQLIGQLDVIGEQTGIQPRPNINELIEQLKPKFVYGRSYFNKFSKESGRNEIVHYVDPYLINRYYNYSGFGSVYQLKPEFDKRRCVKDEKSGEWRFQN